MKKSLILLIFKVAAALLAYLVNIVVARLYEIDLVGNFFLFTTTIIIFSSVIKLGLDLNTIKVIPILLLEKKTQAIERYINLSIVLIFIGGIIVGLPLIFFIFAFTADLIIGILSIIALISYALKDVLAAILRASKFYYSSSLILNLTIPFISLTFFLFLYIAEFKVLIKPFYVFILASTISLFIGISLIKNTFNNKLRDLFKINFSGIFDTINFTKYQITLLNVSIIWIPNLIIGTFYSSEDVAHFNISNRTAIFISFIYLAVENYIGPKISSEHAQNNEKGIQDLFTKTSILSTVIATFVFGIFLIYSKNILLLFGPNYIQNESYLIILSTAQFINVLSGNAATYLLMTGREHKVRNTYLVVVVCMIFIQTVVSRLGLDFMIFVCLYALTIAVFNLWFAYLVYKDHNLKVSFFQSISLKR